MAGPEVTRRDVLDATSRLLAEEGAAALSVRRIAREVGASTMVVYTLFGDKDGLLDALMAEGFSRFAATLRRAREPDPWEHLGALGRAYRAFAKDNPSYFKLMWDPGRVAKRSGEAASDSEASRHGQDAFASLIEAVTRVMAALDRPARDIEPAAIQVWSAVHGFVSLELAHELPEADAEALYEQTLEFVARGLGRS